MAGLLLGEESVDAALGRLVALARAALAGVDDASLSLVRRGRFETPAATSADVRHADETQYRAQRGPCVEATHVGGTVNIDVAETHGRWPEFAETARSTGYRSVLSTALVAQEQRLGALNLYSRGHRGFELPDERAAKAFADHAAVVVAEATAAVTGETMNARLREAVATRDLINRATGVLIGDGGMGADEAFEILRRTAHRSGRKMRDVAVDVVRDRQARRRPKP